MKKFAAALLGLSLLAGIAAPAFAWDADNCPFSDASLCVVETIAPLSDD